MKEFSKFITYIDLSQYQFEYQQPLLCISIAISMYNVYNYIIAYKENTFKENKFEFNHLLLYINTK